MRSKLRTISLLGMGTLAGVCLSLGISVFAQRERPAPLPLDELRQFTSVYETIKNNYVEPVSDEKLFSSAISGMLSDLDPHSAYLDAEAFADLQNQTHGEFGGLGIEVGLDEGFVKVISPIEGTPAERAGVMAGDLIIKIDDKSTKNMSLNDAVKLMRGQPGEAITLSLIRKGVPTPIVMTIKRELIKVQSVRSKMLDHNIAYVRISQFQERTGADLVQHLKNLGQQGAPAGIVLDLRNDPGGLLASAIGVSGAFLQPNTLITSTDGRNPESKRQYLASPEFYLRSNTSDYLKGLPAWIKTTPMVVLTNGGSASASEIVAGALQDYKRASVLGTRSFGKGSVQVILPLTQDTGIKLTTSRYFTPSGRSIQATGIEPDYLVAETPTGDLIERPREADLDGHLSNGNNKNIVEQKSSFSDPAKALEAAQQNRRNTKPLEFGSAEDYQLQQAINLLLGKPVSIMKVEAKTDTSTNDAAEAQAIESK